MMKDLTETVNKKIVVAVEVRTYLNNPNKVTCKVKIRRKYDNRKTTPHKIPRL